jgi:hypothetical protein
MSGGRWGYQQWKIQELAENLASDAMVQFLKAIAETEHLIDWAVCGDTLREDVEPKLYDLWRDTFDRVYG